MKTAKFLRTGSWKIHLFHDPSVQAGSRQPGWLSAWGIWCPKMPRPFRGAPESSSLGITNARPSQCLPPVDYPVIKVTVSGTALWWRGNRQGEDTGSAWHWLCPTMTIWGRLETVSAFLGIRFLMRWANHWGCPLPAFNGHRFFLVKPRPSWPRTQQIDIPRDLVRTARLKGTKWKNRVRSTNRRDKKVTVSECSKMRKW